ncbi:MAG: tandem-95 repeat protein, partial [Acidimicrobiia bacterium]|nr:tandem-95 repeat protein [Acidimicrobiia bacterium]
MVSARVRALHGIEGITDTHTSKQRRQGRRFSLTASPFASTRSQATSVLATRSRSRNSLAILAALSLVFSLLAQTGFGAGFPEAAAAIETTIDEGGANDPQGDGQKDLTQFTLDTAPGMADTWDIRVGWSWDETTTTQTADACSLYDTDDDGLANYAVCVTIVGDPAEPGGGAKTAVQAANSPRIYECTADSRADRCAGDSLLSGPYATTCSVTSNDPVDPFSAGDDYPNDTTALCDVDFGDFPVAVTLINACSYPSEQPNSSASDCVLIPREGFIQIVKVATPDDGTVFSFAFDDGDAATTDPAVTISGSGTEIVPVVTGASYSVSETVPDGWQLDSAACVDAALNSVGTSTATGVTGVAAGELETVVCTFTNSIANLTPVAVDDGYSTPEDTLLTVAAPGILGNDSDVDGDALTVTLLTDPTDGTLTQNADGSFTYLPDTGFAGVDSYTYKACDPSGACDQATVTITVTDEGDPVANDDSATTTEDTPVSGNWIENDDMTDDAVLALQTGDATPSNGTVTVNTDGTYDYTPNTGFAGTDTFTYTICDDDSPTPTCDQATVAITVTDEGDPVANDDSATTTEDTPVSG